MGSLDFEIFSSVNGVDARMWILGSTAQPHGYGCSCLCGVGALQPLHWIWSRMQQRRAEGKQAKMDPDSNWWLGLWVTRTQLEFLGFIFHSSLPSAQKEAKGTKKWTSMSKGHIRKQQQKWKENEKAYSWMPHNFLLKCFFHRIQ